MAFILPVKLANGLATVGVALNANERVDLFDSAGTDYEVTNVPDATPTLGGKFPAYDSAGAQYLISFIGSSSPDVVEETISGPTSGDARIRSRSAVADGEPWYIRARVTNDLKEAYGYQAFASVTVNVFDVSLGGVDLYIPADPALAALITSSLLAWDYDDEGYNVYLAIVPTQITGGTEGGHAYKVEIALTLTTGGVKVVEAWFVARSEQAV